MIITKHCQERYVERVMDKSEDINAFLTTHTDKVNDNIEKLITYGTIVYEGNNIKDYKNTIRVILNGTWIILIDVKQDKVVTLFSLDLGLGKEFNEDYINRMITKLQNAKIKVQDQLNVIDNSNNEYQQKINENNDKITLYRKYIKSMEQENASLNELILQSKTDKEMAERELLETLSYLLQKRVY